jgi:hypothetical protein
MIDIPPEVRIRSLIRTGSVYYFPEDTFSSTVRHFFIVLNSSPATDRVLLLVCSSSRIEAVKRRRRHQPSQTIVEIAKTEYADFTVNSIVDCNTIIPKTISELASKLNSRELLCKTVMDASIVEKLRQGVLVSPLVADEHKDLLRNRSVS